MVRTCTAAGLVVILLFTHCVCSEKLTCSVAYGCEGCTYFTCNTGPVSWSSLSVERLKPMRGPIAECSRSTKHEPDCMYFTEVCYNRTASIKNGALLLCLRLQDARGTVYQCQIPGDQYQSEACEMDSGTVSSQGPVLPGASDSEAAGDVSTPQNDLSIDTADWKTSTIVLCCIIGIAILLVVGCFVGKSVILNKKNTPNEIQRVTVLSQSDVPPATDSNPCHDTLTRQHTQVQATANEAIAIIISSNQSRPPAHPDQADRPPSKKNTSNEIGSVTSTVPPAPDSNPCHDVLTGQHTQVQATANEVIAISSNQSRPPAHPVQADPQRTYRSSVTSILYQQEEACLLPSGASAALVMEPRAAAYEVNESEEEGLEDVSRGCPSLFAVEVRPLLEHETTHSSKLGHPHAIHLVTETQDL